MATTVKTAFKLSIESRNYLKDVFGYERVEDVDSATAHAFVDNIECEPTPGEYGCDRELWKAYCQLKGIKEGMTADQFLRVRHRYDNQ
jgi:hypothetical protein